MTAAERYKAAIETRDMSEVVQSSVSHNESKIELLTTTIAKISTCLPPLDRLILEKNYKLTENGEILTSCALLKEYFETPATETDIYLLKKKLAKIVCALTYQECNAVFSTVFKDYTSDRSKEVARNNVRRLSGEAEASVLSSKVYGEVEFYSFCNLLERIDIKQGETFFDLGHGTGKAMVGIYVLRFVVSYPDNCVPSYTLHSNLARGGHFFNLIVDDGVVVPYFMINLFYYLRFIVYFLVICPSVNYS